MNVVQTKYTKLDLLNSIDWFNSISAGLGDQFETEYYTALQRVKDSPKQFSAGDTGYRPCRLKRFTAVIYSELIVTSSLWLDFLPTAKTKLYYLTGASVSKRIL